MKVVSHSGGEKIFLKPTAEEAEPTKYKKAEIGKKIFRKAAAAATEVK